MFACPFVAPNWLPFVTPALWHILAILHGPIRRRNGRPISDPIGPICDIPPRSAILTVCYKFKMVPVVRYKFKMAPAPSSRAPVSRKPNFAAPGASSHKPLILWDSTTRARRRLLYYQRIKALHFCDLTLSTHVLHDSGAGTTVGSKGPLNESKGLASIPHVRW